MSEAQGNGVPPRDQGSPGGEAEELPSDAAEEPALRLGGMALRNGLLVHGPTSWAAAARGEDGEIHVASGPKPVIAPALAARVPLLRGPLRLAEAFAVIPIVRSKLPSARLPFEAPRVIAAMIAASAAGRVLRERAEPTAKREALAAAIGMVPAMTALADRDLASYHGVEHKAIGAYEQGSLDPSDATKEHERCGSNLIAPLLIFSAAGQLLIDRVLERPGPIARTAIGVTSVGLAAEMFAWSERHSETSLAKAYRRPGHEIQRLVATKEPTGEQLDVGVAAMAEILRIEEQD
ncbi:MAG: DUF1385 domain-containing protein [Solirubrobacterales bacterium]